MGERDVCLLQLNLLEKNEQHLPLGDSVPAQSNKEEVKENNSSCYNSVTAAVCNGQTTFQALTEVENRRHFQAESQSTASHLFIRTRLFHRPAFIRPGHYVSAYPHIHLVNIFLIIVTAHLCIHFDIHLSQHKHVSMTI